MTTVKFPLKANTEAIVHSSNCLQVENCRVTFLVENGHQLFGDKPVYFLTSNQCLSKFSTLLVFQVSDAEIFYLDFVLECCSSPQKKRFLRI